jgi:hypothetical protein
MQSLMRFVFICYMVYLTALLWTKDPSQLIGGQVPGFLEAIMFMAHTLAFMVLAMLAFLACWPAPHRLIVVLLAAYGGMTEIVQGFLPPRTPKWTDWCQDLLGIGIGAALCWIAAIAARAVMKSRQGWEQGVCPAPAEVEVLQNVAPVSDVGGRSPPR